MPSDWTPERHATARALAARQEASARTASALHGALAEIERLQALLYGMSAHADARRHLHASEDPSVVLLCERWGFGAVMDSAARQWQRRDPVGAWVTGPCLGTLRRLPPRVIERDDDDDEEVTGG